MKKESCYKYALTTHVVTLLLGLAVLLLVDARDKLIWNMGFLILWLFIGSSIYLFIAAPPTMKRRKLFRSYLLTLGLLPVIISALCGFYFFMVLGILVTRCFPDKMITANEPYIIRKAPSEMRTRGDCLYMTQGIIEKYQGDLEKDHEPVLFSEGQTIQLVSVDTVRKQIVLKVDGRIQKYSYHYRP